MPWIPAGWFHLHQWRSWRPHHQVQRGRRGHRGFLVQAALFRSVTIRNSNSKTLLSTTGFECWNHQTSTQTEFCWDNGDQTGRHTLRWWTVLPWEFGRPTWPCTAMRFTSQRLGRTGFDFGQILVFGLYNYHQLSQIWIWEHPSSGHATRLHLETVQRWEKPHGDCESSQPWRDLPHRCGPCGGRFVHFARLNRVTVGTTTKASLWTPAAKSLSCDARLFFYTAVESSGACGIGSRPKQDVTWCM